MLAKTKVFAQKPVITPLTLVFIMIRLAIDVVESSSWYEMSGKIIITLGMILSGAKLTDIKEVMVRLKTVLKDPKTTLIEKIGKVFDIVITGCAVLGQLHDESLTYPIEDFIHKKEEEKSPEITG